MLLFAQHVNSQVQTPRYISITTNTKAFYEYLPQGYSATSTPKYPFILFLHGMGELGDGSAANLPLVLRNGPPKLINQGTFPTSFTVNGQTQRFIILSPQFVSWPTAADVDAVISYAISNYNVDPARVYITGLSMGGGATWEYGGNDVVASYSLRVAAIAPVCGAAYPSTYRAQVISTNKVAVWAFHNDGDPTAPVFYTNDMVNYINSTSPPPAIPAKKTIFVSNSHDAWTKAYDPNYREAGMNVYEWMLQYSRASLPNTAPTVNAGSDQSITLPSSSVQLNGSASDPGGSVASYNWSKVSGPSQFSFSNTSVVNPTVSNLAQGTYTFRLTVTDNQGATATDDVNIIVNGVAVPPPAGTKYIKVNLYGGTNAYNNSEWNNWNTNSSSTSGNMKYSDGTLSSVNTSITQNGVSDNGSSYTSIVAPSEVIRYASYSTSSRTLIISGLDNSKTYDLELYASRSGAANNTTRFTIGSTSFDIKTDNNSSSKASFTSLMPGGGQIKVSVDRLNAYNYLNGFILTEKGTGSANALPMVNAGNDQSITLPVSSVQLSGSATDADGSIASYNWSKISGPSQFTFGSTSVANPVVSNLAQGTYTFSLTVTDNQGATATDDVNVVVNGVTVPPPAGTKYVKINLYGGTNAYSNTEWNNWNTNFTSSGPLKYSDGTTSAVSAIISQNGVSDNGSSYVTTMAPSEVLRYTSYSTSSRTLTVSGLDNSKTYDLELYASRSGTSNNTTRFTVASTSIDIKTDNNLSNKASFASLIPSAGKITVSIDKLNTYNYVNGFILSENSTDAAPVVAKSTLVNESTVSSVDVFPNPVADRLVLQVNNNYIGQMKAQIIDMSGIIQQEFSLSKNQSGSSQSYLFIGNLKQGEYIIRIQIGKWVESKKISKL